MQGVLTVVHNVKQVVGEVVVATIGILPSLLKKQLLTVSILKDSKGFDKCCREGANDLWQRSPSLLLHFCGYGGRR